MSSSLLSSIFGGDGSTGAKKKKRNAVVKDESSGGGFLNSLFSGSAKLETLEEKKKVSARAKEDTNDVDPSASTPAEPKVEVKDGPKKKKRKPKKSEEAIAAAAAAAAATAQEDDNEADTDGNGDCTIFVGNLPPSTTRRSLATMFKSCGKVESSRLRSIAVEGVKLPPDKAGDQNLMRKVCVNTKKVSTETPKKTVQGYVVFASADSVAEALKMNNKVIKADGMNLRLRVDRSKPSIDSTRSVFVGNLPYGADEASLRNHFVVGCEMDDGDVENVRIIRDPETQQCKGFGYVLLSDRSHVASALQMHDTVYMRRHIRVMVCGKRFKGKKGRVDAPADAEGSSNSRKFEGRRATEATGGARRVSGKKRKQEYSAPSAGAASFLKAGSSADGKKKRMRGAPPSEKNRAGGRKAGVSRRAATEAKANKRVKQLNKRVAKGMGKSK